MADLYKLEPGAAFAGDFRVVRPISAGGMGAVYEVEQVSTGKHRALKVMLPQLVADPSLRKRFEQEARIASMIESEHVVEVVGAGIDPEQSVPWLAMELLVGEDLAKTVARRGALPVPEVVALFEQLCHAVAAAHRAGIVHRDLKPENIFLAQSRRAGTRFTVKVLDFGIAKIVAEAKTRLTAAMGSPIWMAPEQAERSPITPATDVWALGLVAFYLLTGRFFWKAANSDEATIPQLMREVLFEPIVPASIRTGEVGMTLPPGFDGWFARCVAREPASRFADASQAWAALGPALGQGGHAEAYMATAVQSAPSPSMTRPDGSPLQVANTSASGQAAPRATYPPAIVAQPGGATGGAAAYTIPGQGQGVPAAPGLPPVGPRSSLPLIAIGAVVLGMLFALGGFAYWLKRAPTPGTAAALPATATSAADVLAVADASLVALSADSGPAAAAGGVADLRAPAPSLSPGAPPPSVKGPTKTSVADAPTVAARAAALAVPKAPAPAATSPSPVGAPPAPAAPPAASPEPPPAPKAVATQRSVVDLARSTVSADWPVARAMLEPKVVGGTASVDEIRLLDEICKNQRDRPCQKMCKRQLRRLGLR